jgi:hypothetical protein
MNTLLKTFGRPSSLNKCPRINVLILSMRTVAVAIASWLKRQEEVALGWIWNATAIVISIWSRGEFPMRRLMITVFGTGSGVYILGSLRT